MNNEQNGKSSPNQLKEKIEKLRKELANTQAIPSETASSEAETPTAEANNLAIIEDLEQEIDLLLKDNMRLREEKLLALADGENLKKRIHTEVDDIKRYRAAGMAEKLLPTLDNFERALQVTNVTPEVKNFLTGFEMINRMFKTVFEEEGITVIDTKVGEHFNSNLHAAIEIVESTDVDSGCIVQIMQKGYMIHDRVLRHASVQVAK
ncbi:MAG: nucleotide exchange factor GrpE [Spiroplasma poulsonii]|uniref:Protein GrpE n=1 Tax=Spiroplasma poulsonii TaxID=2138 RepID=A0A2P6FAQ8_9MOLU|nr:nucleotide exchange factor GrpE [Spiroplasma poulsonii]KAF0851752.1 heat shock protein GrpE [Spiroplasma poulsonii]MBW1242119.1 nucleotide exchange factor GrpE [Spiroplasma poulsonii]PQM30541.1 heat shock protein GrpE [Spiroplasma poulsonii]PWF95515.1 heat shock protein GrpE [Spiroplasma poulsonii]PWF98297.1 heat shock protein GrpE [Spiroplasma poulsonii]